MCFSSGLFWLDGGFRVAIAKHGYKWAYLMYLDCNRVRCKRIKSDKVGNFKPIGGKKQYTTADLADQFLTRKNLVGSRYPSSKMARQMLIQAREVL